MRCAGADPTARMSVSVLSAPEAAPARPEAAPARPTSQLRLLATVIAHGDGTFAERVRRALSLTTTLLGYDIGLLSQVEGDSYTVVASHAPEAGVEPGATFRLGETYCCLTLEADDLLEIDYTDRSPYRAHPCYSAFGLESYVGAPIRVGSHVWGTLNFSSPEPRAEPLTEADLDLIRLLAVWVGGVLEGEARERAIRELDQQVRTVLSDAPVVLYELDVNGTFTLIEGAGLDDLGVTSSQIVGQCAFDLYSHVEVSQRAFHAVLGGAEQTWEAAVDGRVFANHAKPSFGLDGTVTGLVGVSFDVTERKRAEQQLERQADRLRRFLNAAAEPGTFQEQIGRVLEVVANLLSLDAGLFAQVEDDQYICQAGYAREGETLAPGDTLPLGLTYCDITVSEGDVVAIEDMSRSDYRHHPCYAAVGLAAYIGVPIRVENEVYGALSFSSMTPASEPFTEGDRQFIRLVAQWAGERVERHLRSVRLAESEERFRALSEATFEGVAYSERGVVTDANEQFAWLFGYATPEAVVGMNALDFCAPEYVDKVREMNGQNRPGTYEVVCVRRDGSRFWAELQGRPATVEGRAVRITAIRNITDRKRTEEQRRFQADVLGHVSDAVVALDLEGRITYWNAGAERLHGHAASDVLGRPLDEVVQYLVPEAGGSGSLEVTTSPEQALQSAAASDGELIYVGPDGERRFVSVSSSVIRSDDGRERGLLAVARDVTAQRQLAARLRHQAMHDALTGLPNRTLFRSRIEASLAEHAPFAVLFVDLDHFKVVNDSLGHDAGDRLLTTIALRLRAALGHAEGAVVARLGGDEFGIFVPTEAVDPEAVGRRVLETLDAPVDLGARSITPSASVGIVARGEVYETPEDLLRDADTAMYAAKHEGRQRLSMFTPAMHRAAALRFGLEQDLRSAAERGQLRLALQPIVRLGDGTVAGFEALIRWEHPDHGFLPPGRFLPLAEEIGVVADLDRWVAEEACRTVAPWLAEADLSLSVNCSDRTFLDPTLADRLGEATRAAGVPPGTLVLELTERAFVNLDAAVVRAEALREAGFHLAVDDFGSGYSSLGLLHALPLDSVKIDRTFVSDLATAPTARAIVRSVVQMTNALDLQSVAEGVETPEQLRVLRAKAAPLAQGYLFSRPVPPEEARAMLDAPPWAGDWEAWTRG